MDNERLHYRVRGRRNMCYHKNSFSDAGSTSGELSLQQKHASCQIKTLEKAISLPLRSLFIKEAPDFDRLPIPMCKRTDRWPEQHDHIRRLRAQSTELATVVVNCDGQHLQVAFRLENDPMTGMLMRVHGQYLPSSLDTILLTVCESYARSSSKMLRPNWNEHVSGSSHNGRKLLPSSARSRPLKEYSL